MSATVTMEGERRLAAVATRSRAGALAGLAFAVSFFLGVAMLSIPRGASDAELVARWSDGGNRAAAIVSMYLFVLAGLCFLGLLVSLRSRLLEREGGTGEGSTLALTSGAVFVAMLFVAAASRGVIGFAVESPANEESLPGADALRYLPQIGYAVTGVGGMLAAAVTMAAVSWVVLRTRAFGRWLAWIGIAAAVVVTLACVALSGVLAIPAVLVWACAASLALWRGGRP